MEKKARVKDNVESGGEIQRWGEKVTDTGYRRCLAKTNTISGWESEAGRGSTRLGDRE